jgi:UDP-glucose 4-epimerase
MKTSSGMNTRAEETPFTPERPMGKSVLVTGGAGFVGSNLCEALAKRGDRVVSLDNYFTGSEDNHVDGVTYVRGDTRDIFEALEGFGPFDLVYHLGEYSRVEQSFEDLDLLWQYNLVGTSRVLDYVRDQPNAKLVYSGSSTKFAQVDQVSPYQWSKAHNTEFVQLFCDRHDIPYAITYFYNVYGPREISTGTYATLIAKFAELKRQGLPLTVTLPGTQRRNFTYIGDIVSALLLVGDRGIGDGYGIGNPTSYSVLEVAHLFGGAVTFTPEKPGNRMTAELKTEKTLDLGWKPCYSLDTWIRSLE